MTTAVQRRRGTTVQHSTFTGLEGEVTIDTTKDTIVVHDGSTAGGIPILREDFTNGTVAGLGSIIGADTADDDQFLIFDTSTSSIKKISRAELNNAIEQDAIAALTITGNLTLSGGTANGVTYLNGSKVLTTGSALTFDGTTFSAPNSVITGSSSSDALRITQTGGGNALVVEDSSNPDSTPFVIDASGSVINGYTSTISVQTFNGTNVSPRYFQVGTGYAGSGMATMIYSTTSAACPTFNFGRSKSASIGVNGVVASGDNIGAISFSGDDGTNFIPAASITAAVDGTPGTNDMPGRLVFSTTADGASSPTERMRIDSSGVQRQFGPLVVSNTLSNDVTYDSKSFDVSTQEVGVAGIAFRPDGKMMYVLGTSGDDITYYSLSTAWDITTATYVGESNSTNAQNATPQGFCFNSDGTKVFIVGSATPAGVWAYSCASPWDVSTITYDSVTYDLSAITTSPLGIWFKPDGTKMYIASNTGATSTYTDVILEYSLSTAWLVSSATLTTYFSVASQDTLPVGVQFTEDGLRMFVCGATGDTVVVYDLSTAWDINTATFKYETSNLSTLVGSSITPTDFFIQPNGQTLYVLSDTGSGAGTNMVYQFAASSPATINLTGNTTISGNTTVNQDLTVRGANYFAGETTVNSGLTIGRTAVTSPASTDGNVFSGTYTPTLTNTTNVTSSSATTCQYMRVGNVVTVSGQVDIDPTTTGDTVMGVSLPVASNLSAQTNCGGTFAVLSGTVVQGGSIYADSVNDRVTFRMAASDTANRAYQFIFTYRVI